MTDIDSNRDANRTRTDQDNEKNVTSPIPGGTDAGVPDIDERNRADSPRRGDDVAQTRRDDNTNERRDKDRHDRQNSPEEQKP